MKSVEKGVSFASNYYIYSPSVQAQKTFLYPLFVGYFYYQKGYHIERNTYDSYLIMHIKKGKCGFIINSNTHTASEGQIVLINCYKPHKYFAITDAEVEWLHFDGPTASEYFNLITSNNTKFILSLKDNYLFSKRMNQIYSIFNDGTAIREALTARYITDLLTELIINKSNYPSNISTQNLIEESISFITEHLKDDISLETLASNASLSPYYFTRVFKKETGFTPHQYIISARINHAKFLLKNSDISIKEICFHTGFSSESSFCTSFRNWVHMTPKEYRLNHT